MPRVDGIGAAGSVVPNIRRGRFVVLPTTPTTSRSSTVRASAPRYLTKDAGGRPSQDSHG
jgi:hypothetical protein